jgi:hypothetical protein
MKSYNTDPTQCPHCGKDLDMASPAFSKKRPRPRDISICINCGEWCVFTGTGLRKPSDEEHMDWAKDRKTRLQMKAVREAWERINHGPTERTDTAGQQ